jgi:recombination DNA repair RAD52 pathway protein
MAFTDAQVRLLKAKLDPRYIRTRNANGNTLSYVEGWHAIAEANRIFGYEAWDRRTVSASCVWNEAKAGIYRAVLYCQGPHHGSGWRGQGGSGGIGQLRGKRS